MFEGSAFDLATVVGGAMGQGVGPWLAAESVWFARQAAMAVTSVDTADVTAWWGHWSNRGVSGLKPGESGRQDRWTGTNFSVALDGGTEAGLPDWSSSPGRVTVPEMALARIVDGLDSWVLVTALESHEVLFVNEAVRQHWGDGVGRPCWEYTGCSREGPCSHCEYVPPDGETLVTERYCDRSGVWYQCRDQIIKWPDGRRVRLRLATDISKCIATRRELVVAKELADHANQAKSRFLAMMSHEIRTPLNSILGFSELINNQWLGPIGNEQYTLYADYIMSSGRHLLDLVNDFLDIAKIEAGRQELDWARISVPNLLMAVTALQRERATSSGIGILIDCPDDILPLWADERAVRQILFNLVSNAVKFSSKGSEVRVAAALTPAGEHEISVSDQGSGIEADQLDRLLRPFEQIDNRYAGAAGGTGLGLYLVKSLIGLHGGSFAIESAVGRGTVATVRFPPQPAALAPAI